MSEPPARRDPLVDLIVAVHTEARPIARAVGSVIEGTSAPVRVTVVAHNIAPELIARRLGGLADHPGVRLVSHADGIHSPSGPLNAGLDLATARFTSVMGSDDELAPGAIDSWLAVNRAVGADMVLARVERVGIGLVKEPPVRPGRTARLDGVRDRLAYRSAPLGLISRERFGDLRFDAGLPSGEDIAYVNRIWFSGAPIAFDRRGPAYLVHDDADDRVTSGPRPVASDFAFLNGLLDVTWFDELPSRAREALVVKLLRTQLFDAVLNRIGSSWSDSERADLTAVARRILQASPGAERLLSRLDRNLLDAILDPHTPHDRLAILSEARRRYATAPVVLTRRLRDALHPQAPFRTLAAGYLVR